MSDAGIDQFSRWAQTGDRRDVRLVRLSSPALGNVYPAEVVTFTVDGGTTMTGEADVTVTNLAEPPDADGALAEGAEALAVDVDGRWVIFVARPNSATFLARVDQAHGAGVYTVVEQACSSGIFSDATGAAGVSATNLAEIDLGSGRALDVDSLVLVLAVADADGQLRYAFDHPVYARYME